MGYAISGGDLFQHYSQLQLKATSGEGYCTGGCGPGGYNNNGNWIHDSIIDSAGAALAGLALALV